MTTPHWPRPQWRDSGDEAFLLWFVFGDFGDDFQVDAQKYRTRGTPPGIDVVRYVNRELARWDGYPLAGMLGGLLYEEDAPLFERAKRAGECVMLRGSLAYPPDLDALRDLVGTITALMDGGGVAVIDPQTLSMFDAPTWRERFFAACAIARETSEDSKGFAKQGFYILDKVAEIDAFLRSHDNHASGVFETHPELAFVMMNGGKSLALPKKVKSRVHMPGLELRRALLAGAGIDAGIAGKRAPKGAADADLVDALA